MNRSRSEGAFDEAIAHELMRYSSDLQDLLSLDDALAHLAHESWNRAEAMADQVAVHDTPQITPRQDWAAWFMARRLFDTSVSDPA